MDHSKKIRVTLYACIAFVLALLVAMICYTGSAETAKAFDDVYKLVDFSESYGDDLSFPYDSTTIYYTNYSGILDSSNTATISSNTRLNQGHQVNLNSGQTATLSQSIYSSSSIGDYHINCTQISVSDKYLNYYFIPYYNSNLSNYTGDLYFNLLFSGTFTSVVLDFKIGSSYSTSYTLLSNETYSNGIVIKYPYGSTNSNYFMRLRIRYTSSDFSFANFVTNKPYVFNMGDGSSNYLKNRTSYTGSYVYDSTSDWKYTKEIGFNYGTNVSVNDTYYWSYQYWYSLFNNANPVFICDLTLNGNSITFPMYIGQNYAGISDTVYESVVGEFVLDSYTYRLEFFNCNYDSNEYIYDFAIQLMNNTSSSYTLSSFKLSQYNNVLNNQNYNDGYNTGYNSGYNSGYSQGTIDSNKDYNNGYSAGYQTGLDVAENGTFLGLFVSAVESPLQAVLNMFDVEILGYNMKSLYMALITLALVLFIVRLIMTGSKGKSD